MQIETLQKWKELATIISLIAVPLIVATTTEAIQNRIAAESARKDYVALAIGILTKKKDEQPDIELRQWAADIVDKNAPVKLPASLKARLGNGGVWFTTLPVYFSDGATVYGAQAIDDAARRELEKTIKDAERQQADKAAK